MHSYLLRLNGVATFAIIVLALMCIATTLSDFFHQSSPQLHIQVLRYEGLRRQLSGNDEARLRLNISADLSSLFSWNTKQLFVFVAAEYETQKNSLNQISLWDKIITSKEEATFQHLDYNKYGFVDQGSNLRGLDFNLTVYWNVMPIVGRMYADKISFPGFRLPTSYR